MSFNISAWSIRKPVPTIILFLILTLLGLFAFPILGIDANPNVDIPSVSVTVAQPGADPAELEFQVTKKVEDAVAGLGNIDHIISVVNDGVSSTTINFILGTNSDRATNDVRNSIAQIRASLPQDINEPIVKRIDSAVGSIMSYAVVSEQRSVEELSDLIDRTISRALLSVRGVAQVQRIGGVDREISVNLNPDRLQSLGITATQVNEQIRRFNVNLPGGRTNVGNSEQTVRTLGSANSLEAFKNYQIVLPKGGSVPLSALGEISDSYSEPRQAARLYLAPKHKHRDSHQSPVNSQQKSKIAPPVVAFSVLRSTGSTLVTVEEGVQAAVAQLQKTLPKDIKLELIYTQADFIRESYHASIDALVLGAALAVVTILIFLRDWRATFITALALPLSIIPTFWVFQALNYTLNFMTLLALALVVGILVDDAIVEIENIERHMQMGKTPYQAALDASDEIGLAVVATTMTIVAVFVPVAFMGGIPGQYFRPFGVTVAVSVLFSLLVARTVTPLMAAYLLKDNHNRAHKDVKRQPSVFGLLLSFIRRKLKLPNLFKSKSHQQNTTATTVSKELEKDQLSYQYRRLLTWSLKHRVITLLLAVAFFIGSLMLVPLIPTGFIDNQDTALSNLAIEMPPGSTLNQTDETAQQAIELLRQEPEVVSILATIGAPSVASNGGPSRGGGGASGVNSATLYVKLTPREERQISQQQFEEHMRQKFLDIPGARIGFSQGRLGSKKQLSILLKSENSESLTSASETLLQQMRQLPGLVEATSSASLVKPEILIQPDPNRAADQGVSVQQIAQTASLATLGDNDANLPKFDLEDRQIPIRVQLSPQYRMDMDTIRNLQVPGKNGNLVPLMAVADINLGSGPSQIDRFDRSRQVSVEANLKGLTLGEAYKKVQALPGLNPLPPDVVQEAFGDAKVMKDIFAGFAGALGTAVLFIYAVLVLLFNNFLNPLTIMAALPLSIGGAFLGLLVAQKALGLYSLIGIVLLMGIVTKNSILLVDYALLNQQEGKPLFRAVLESGVARLRPIIMTTIAMIAGMVPIAMEIGAGSQVRSPMAIAVVGGLMTSTLLTLIVIPVIYTYMSSLQSWFFKRFRPKVAKSV